MRAFAWFVRRIQPLMARRWGAEFARVVIADVRDEYGRLAPQLPDIGGWRNVFTPVMVVNGWMVALHRAMARRGRTPQDTIAVCAELSDDVFRAVPTPVLRLVGRLAFTRPVQWVFERQAARSRRRAYPADFVYAVRVGDDGELALVFEECAVNKFYAAQNVRELAPFCNFFDVTYSRLMGMGIDASQTIGLGCSTCELRYKHGRPTAVPPALREVLPRGG